MSGLGFGLRPRSASEATTTRCTRFETSNRINLGVTPLITTDGFKFYEGVIGRVFGPACIYGQVIKTRRNDRVVRVERRAVIAAGGLKQALRNSEDSLELNTSLLNG